MRKVHKTVLTMLMSGLIAISLSVAADAQDFATQKTWSFGTQAGAQARTVAGTAFVIAGNVDYSLHPEYSVGMMAFASSATGLTEYAGAFTGSYHIDAGMFSFVPFAGIGALHADYESNKSTGVYIPLGMTAEYRVGGSTFTGTALINLHQLRWDVAPTRDRGSAAFMLGVRL